ncbi:MAG: hypothetical protein OEU93_18400, partial [Rubrivivax sp.]|nr:hypothetical protein [Rubrivivax sp.]
TIKQSGCAISSMAMAISKIARRIYTPLDVDRWIDAHGGYGGTGGDEIKDWNVIAQIAGLGAERKSDNSLPTINRELDRGRPVVLGVDKTGDDVPDHWIALTRRGSESGQTVYYANDPATGLVIRMLLQGQEIVYDSRNYRSTGDYTIITGG